MAEFNKINTQCIPDIQKSVDIMKNLVDQLDLNQTKSEVIDLLRDELHTLDDTINDLWESHPNLDLSELNYKVMSRVPIPDLRIHISDEFTFRRS